jgi:hypothetical protein
MRVGDNGDPYIDFSNLTREQATALSEFTVVAEVKIYPDAGHAFLFQQHHAEFAANVNRFLSA